MTSPRVLFKGDVSVGDPPSSEQVRLLAVIDQGARLLGIDLTVTSGKEGHPLADPHSQRKAFDVRTSTLGEGQILALYKFWRETLGDKWTVLFESPQKPNGVIGSITYVNPHATGPHFHLQSKKETPQS